MIHPESSVPVDFSTASQGNGNEFAVGATEFAIHGPGFLEKLDAFVSLLVSKACVQGLPGA